MANTTLSITYGSAGNRNKWTWSGWVKRSKLGGHQSLWSRYGDSSNIGDLRFQSDDGFTYQNYSSGSTNAQWNASQKFRDTNAWYHIVFVWDSSNATAADRMKAYVNGEDMAGSANAVPSQNTNSIIGSAAAHKIGSRNSDQYFDGLMSHVHFCDGYAYSPTDFGETDSTTGIWKPKTNPSVTYGTNGFFLDFADSSAMGNDISGNNNDFTVSGTMTQTIDTPSNVFATWNALGPFRLGGGSIRKGTFSNGNTKVAFSSSTYVETISATLAVSSGKWYWEVKPTAGVSYYGEIGIKSTSANGNNFNGDSGHPSILYKYDGTKNYNTIDGTSYGNSYTNNDIIGIALDLDNKAIWFSKNGTWQNSATQSEIEAGTTTNAAFSGTSASDGFPSTSSTYTPYIIGGDGGGSPTFEANFGNGYFGTTAVASAGTNSGIGTFEYDVPSGYKALCTKNINEQEYS